MSTYLGEVVLLGVEYTETLKPQVLARLCDIEMKTMRRTIQD